MNPIVRNILAVISGLVVGSTVNMGIIMISGSIIPPPEGVDNTTVEGLKAGMHLFQPKHFLFPFLAHAIGTFAGALLAAIISANRKMLLALVVGAFFLAGGIANILMLPSPTWFTIVDLAGAYFPMAFLGGKMVVSNSKK
ncbi:MAG TPA: hypothetical protein P5210_16465 [Draconibacterium sp.]|nr:hypothetical protein [Draconibacterium sp.]HRX13259.1 hypothetical protein [Draconibacterium sp.]